MKEFKAHCTLSKSDYFEVQFFKKVGDIESEFGFDFFDGDINAGGILLSQEDARKLIEFLKEKLDNNN